MSKNGFSRRDFFKVAGAAGVGSIAGSLGVYGKAGASKSETNLVPQRPFGNTGINVPILSLGGMFDIPSNQLMLKQAIRWGVTYWDTAHIYGGGRSEEGMGKFFARYPDQRKSIFLVTKSTSRSRRGMSRDLETSLKRMNTAWVDLFFVHAIDDIRTMSDAIRRWGEEQKKAGKIRLFGFSTHENMENCLKGASTLGWIDAIMMTYNFRLMHEKKMIEAVNACADAGIGLTAMKTQGGEAVGTDTKKDLELGGKFMVRGFTDKQAKLKAVWENNQISCICSQMPTFSILMSNIAAALDKTSLTKADRKYLDAYAADTFSNYCAGCTAVCNAYISADIPVGDVMRCLMYARSYGDLKEARRLFYTLPETIRNQMIQTDYTLAEKHCPRKLNIGLLMKDAASELA